MRSAQNCSTAQQEAGQEDDRQHLFWQCVDVNSPLSSHNLFDECPDHTPAPFNLRTLLAHLRQQLLARRVDITYGLQMNFRRPGLGRSFLPEPVQFTYPLACEFPLQLPDLGGLALLDCDSKHCAFFPTG